MKLWIMGVFLGIVVMAGCATEQTELNVSDEEPRIELPEDLSNLSNVSDAAPGLPGTEQEVSPTACTAGWRCISSQIKAYQKSNCSWGERVTCRTGCFNDTCRPASVCTSGFICLNSGMRAYQKEDCTTIQETECPGGCAEGDCLFYNETAAREAAEQAAEEAANAPPPDTSRTLSMGQQEIVTVSEQEHTIGVHILEESRVKFSVDGFKTDWMGEGDSIIIRGINLTIREILFKPYEGGVQQARYTAE